ncbi:MAG: LysR family transcriptional regulator [Deltaproteobacteria bacterium]|nr:LysR family transcriptional regulator [Candidatus Anaeroferrophillacea bacterium]
MCGNEQQGEQPGATLQIRSKIWIVNDGGEVIFGLGRLKILEVVERLGSLQAAAKVLRMSYRAVWGRINATEKRLGKPLLVRSIGGSARGGSELTPFAHELIAEFRRLHREVQLFSDDLFARSEVFSPPSTPVTGESSAVSGDKADRECSG